ncbi:hypothetical protein JCM8097_007348 [Rhodosporidiobolus ruineniae]
MPDVDPVCVFRTLGATDNPWTDLRDLLRNQMYLPFVGGFTARVAVLFVLLGLVALTSVLYLFVTIWDIKRKGRKVWLIRRVRRPAGLYLVVNQYLCYPLFSLILSVIWLAYVAYVYAMFGPSKSNPRSLFYWLTLGWLPLFALLSSTTYSTTSSANLASRGRKPNTHRLGPWTSAGLFVVLLPVLLGVVLGTGIWTGSKWHRFAVRWEDAYRFLGERARGWDGTLDEQAVRRADELLTARCAAISPFKHAQFATSMVYIVAAAVLILLNLFSGIYLLSTLRQIDDNHLVVPRGTPLVAPLQPIPTSTGEVATLADVTAGGQPAEWEKDAEVSKLKVHRLRWDVILFFTSVVPSCAAFIAYAAWLGTRFFEVMSHPGQLEFASTGMIWIYSALSLGCLLALTIKTLLSLHAASTRRAAAYDAYPAGLSRSNSAADLAGLKADRRS